MKALVTGATGLVGRHVVQALLDAGYEVRAAVRRPSNGALGSLPVQRVLVGLHDPPRLAAAMSGVDVVFHCAAVYAYGIDQAEVERVNVAGTESVLKAAAQAAVGRVVVTSSSVTCGSSAGPVARTESDQLGDEYKPAYFISKVQQEHVALRTGGELGVAVVLACPTVVLGGPSNRLLPSNAIIARFLLDPTRSTYPGGCNVVSAADVAAGHVLLARHGQPGQRYLLGGENLSWRSLHAMIADLAGVHGPYLELPTSVTWLASAAAEAWAQLTAADPLSTREEALTVGRYYWYSSAKAGALGYRPGPARHAVAAALSRLVASRHLPPWVRSGLRLSDEVHAARRLIPRPL